MVKVLVIADEEAPNLLVRTLRDLAPDLVLSAGDLPWRYVEYVASSVDAPVAFLPGNHDPEIERVKKGRHGTYTCDGLLCDAPRPYGATNVDLRVIEAAGLRIVGLGGCVRYKPGAHQYTQRQYEGRVRRLLRRAKRGGGVDVLLTHVPPLGLGDGEDKPRQGIAAVGPTTIRKVIPWRVVDIDPKSPSGRAPSW